MGILRNARAGYRATVIADSLGPSGCRLTTWELRYWRAIHSELMTHRALSKNTSSSRAIPVEKMMRQVRHDPAGPIWWGKHQKGMQAQEELMGWRLRLAIGTFYFARWFALLAAWIVLKAGLHKQVANRLLEPWMWVTCIVSGTEWPNFYGLRYHRDAQPEFRWLATLMWRAYGASTPRRLRAGDWHLPYVRDEEWGEARVRAFDGGVPIDQYLIDDPTIALLRKVSTGRCARVSYLTHDGRRDLGADIALHDRLMKTADSGEPGHWSPFEHVAVALLNPNPIGNFKGFQQYRKLFPNENFTVFPNLPIEEKSACV